MTSASAGDSFLVVIKYWLARMVSFTLLLVGKGLAIKRPFYGAEGLRYRVNIK
jgi:hypothetical protein